MPRIQDNLLNSVFYLFPSRADAERGTETGGSGFFAGVDFAGNPERRHVYAITNMHNVTCCRDAVVLRVILKGGRTDFWESDPIDWHPSKTDDIDVLPISPERALSVQNLSDGLFVTPENFISETDVKPFQHTRSLGPGDDVFMIGRFISHDGGRNNHPSVRFGNLSMLPAPMKHPMRGEQESFAVEMRSISGYSGSPVFIYWFPGGFQLAHRSFTETFLGVLGVDWGHIDTKLPVRTAHGNKHPDGLYVESHTSMSGVIPAWKLRDFLNSERFKEQRMRDESEIEAQNAASSTTVSVDSAGRDEDGKAPPASDENPKHREDFRSLLDAAVKKSPQGD